MNNRLLVTMFVLLAVCLIAVIALSIRVLVHLRDSDISVDDLRKDVKQLQSINSNLTEELNDVQMNLKELESEMQSLYPTKGKLKQADSYIMVAISFHYLTQ